MSYYSGLKCCWTKLFRKTTIKLSNTSLKLSHRFLLPSIAGVLLCLLLSACSTKLAYNYLDWILEWYVADLVNLTEDQEWQLNDALTKELAWHRKQQLPLYIKSLDQLS